MSTRLRLLVCALATALLPSCVYMHEPFSDDETSVADDRLLGCWEDRDMPIRDGRPAAFRIRKKEGAENTLEMFEPAFEDDRPSAIYIRPGKPALLCVESKDDDGPEQLKRLWQPFKYDMPDERTLRLFPLDRDFIRAAVRSGELAGGQFDPLGSGPPRPRPIPTDAERRPPVIDIGQQDDAATDGWHILLRTSAADVLKFIEKHGAKAFDEPIVLTRVPDERRRSCESPTPATDRLPPQP